MGIKNRQASLVFLYQGLILGVLADWPGSLSLGLAYSFTVFARNPDGTRGCRLADRSASSCCPS
jgi:lipoprotein-releasing system permease protein